MKVLTVYSKSARRVAFVGVASLFFLMIALTTGVAEAGFAFRGWDGPVIFIPPGGPPRTVPTIRPGQPPMIVNLCRANPGRCRWFIVPPGGPIWPVYLSVPLIKDNTAFLSRSPFITPAGIWGIWDPPSPDMVNGDETIRVFELFTGLDLTAPPVGEVDWGQLQSVTGYPLVQVSDFPTGLSPIYQPIGFDPLIDILSSDILGIVTGMTYPTTLVDTTFSDLPALLAGLAPGTSFDELLSYFDGVTGRVVVSYADVPAKDVILYGQAPEPGTIFLFVSGFIAFVVISCHRSQRTPKHRSSDWMLMARKMGQREWGQGTLTVG